MISLKIDPRMKQAIEKMARQEFSSLSGIIKKACQEYLQRNGINWEDEQINGE